MATVESARLGPKLPENDSYSKEWATSTHLALENLMSKACSRDEVVNIDVRRDMLASRLLNRNSISSKPVAERRIRAVWDAPYPFVG